ncbi:MAG TPA: PadR family transcriptional regulator [Patescibacteria group bacterium]|nr:PadR family transcriptional regulator [Patescibacteria group bacterium]
MEELNIENSKIQMRRGVLEFCILQIISREEAYASDILMELKHANLIVVEGTLYPLLSRLKSAGLLKYTWQESEAGPPRKYYQLTEKGEEALSQLRTTWQDLNSSINSLLTPRTTTNEKNY